MDIAVNEQYEKGEGVEVHRPLAMLVRGPSTICRSYGAGTEGAEINDFPFAGLSTAKGNRSSASPQ